MEENIVIVNSEILIRGELLASSLDISQCRKCGSNKMQLWNVGPYELEYGCILCKKKFSSFNHLASLDINDFYNNLSNLYILLEKISSVKNKFYSNKNALKGWQPLFEKIEFEYFELRSGTPYVRAIEFYALGELTAPAKTNRIISQKVKDLVWQRDYGKCKECGTKENLEFDHIIPHSKGGANTYRNIQLLCTNCNKLKSNNIG